MNTISSHKLTYETTQESCTHQGTDGVVSDRPLNQEGVDEALHTCTINDSLEDEINSAPLSDDQNLSQIEVEIQRLRIQQMGQYSGVLYIPPQARASLQVADEEDHVLFPLMEKVLLFLDSDREVFLILGDSGAGKSTFNRHLECALWKAYRKGGPIPLYINLPSIDKPEHDMIVKQLQIHNFTADQIRELKEDRHLILICDGYDESHLTTNLHSKNLLNKPGQWRAKIIISCRTQHLGPDYRGRFQPNVDRYTTRPKELFQEAVIASFSSTQIQEYVEQYVLNEKPAWTPVIYMDKLRRIPHLMDLVSNPFLLSLALEALPNLVGSQDDLESITITRVKLYDNFVDKWLSVGKDRLESSSLGPGGREAFEKLLDSCFEQQAINFAKRLATAIFSRQDGRPVVQYPDPVDGQEWKAEFFGPGSEATHLRMSIPLVRNGKQHRFNHRSLLEYFYSRVFFEPPRPDSHNLDSSEESCVSYQSAVILAHSLNQLNIINEYAVLAFLVERVNAYQAFRDQLNAMVELSKEVPSVSLAAANAMTILVKAGIRFNGKDLQGIRIPGANLSEGEFDLADFQGADLCNVNLTRAWLRQADFKNAHMAGVQFGESPYLAERGGVWSCAYSPDGKKFATGCSSGDISIYSTRTWKKVYALQKSTESVFCIAFSPNSQQLASVHGDGKVRLWNTKAGELEHTLMRHTGQVKCVAYSPDGHQIASGGEDSYLNFWDPRKGSFIHSFKPHKGAINGLSYSPSGIELFTSGVDCAVRLWDLKSRGLCNILEIPTPKIRSIAFSPTGRQVAWGGSDGRMDLRSIRTDEPLCILAKLGGVWSVVFSPDGRYVAASDTHFTIHLWDTRSGKHVVTLDAHKTPVVSLTFSPCGNQIASASVDGTIRLWDAFSNPTTPLTTTPRSATYSPDGTAIISGRKFGSILRLDARTGRSTGILRGHSRNVSAAVYSKDGSRIVSCDDDMTVRIWDVSTNEPLHALKGHSGAVNGVSFSPDGHQVASCSGDKTVRIWDSRTGYLIRLLTGHSHRVWTVAYSPTKPQIASGSDDMTVIVWNTETGMVEFILRGFFTPVRSISYSPDGRRILTVALEKVARIWDSETGKLCSALHCPHSSYYYFMCAEYSPCGELIATGSLHNELRLWSASTEECVLALRCSSSLYQVSWAPLISGSMALVTLCGTGAIQQWEIVLDDKGYQGRLVWSVGNRGLSLDGARIQGAVGLSPANLELFRQHGAVYQAATKKKKKRSKKKKINSASQ